MHAYAPVRPAIRDGDSLGAGQSLGPDRGLTPLGEPDPKRRLADLDDKSPRDRRDAPARRQPEDRRDNGEREEQRSDDDDGCPDVDLVEEPGRLRDVHADAAV